MAAGAGQEAGSTATKFQPEGCLSCATPVMTVSARAMQVLPTCALQTLVLNTNSVGDEGAELLAQKISGATTRAERYATHAPN